MLEHIVERALSGEFEELRERGIGVAVFGKSAAYDTRPLVARGGRFNYHNNFRPI